MLTATLADAALGMLARRVVDNRKRKRCSGSLLLLVAGIKTACRGITPEVAALDAHDKLLNDTTK